MVATSSHKGTPLDQAKLSGPLAIFIGSEGAGLSRDLIKEMDEVVAIPHAPQVESLNAGWRRVSCCTKRRGKSINHEGHEGRRRNQTNELRELRGFLRVLRGSCS